MDRSNSKKPVAPLRKANDSPVSRGQTHREQIYWHKRTVDWNTEWFESTDLPIRVLWTGHSLWLPGDYWERDGSTQLGIELVTRGQLVLQAQGRDWRAQQGDVCVLAKASSYRYSAVGDSLLLKRFVALDGAIVDSMYASGLLGTSPVIRPRSVQKITAILKRLDRLLQTKPESFHMSASAAAYELLLELQTSVRHAWPLPVEQAVRFMTHNIQQPLTVSDLAASAGVSVSHLTLLFRKTIGCSPIQYNIRMKMAAAVHLLTHSDKSIKEIAGLVGYGDQLHFSRSFRQFQGCPPSSFRSGTRESAPNR